VSPPRRLHIAFVLDLFEGVKTGGVISAQRFVGALRERHHVTVVAGGPSREGVVGLPRFTIPPFGKVMREMGFIFGWPTRAILEPVLRRADVVHVQFPFWLGIRTATLARRLGTPVVAASHVQPENLFYNIGVRSPWLNDRTWRFFISRLYGKADHVVVPTEFGLSELRRNGLAVPADVVSNGIPPQFHPGPAERDPAHRGRFVILVVSRLAREKRIDVVVEAVRRARNAKRIQLVVLGAGPEREAIRRAGATLPNPVELRVVEPDEVPGIMRAADLLVHASEIEMEGMAVLEALGTGLPALVASSPLSAASRLAIGDELRFPSGDAADLAARIDALVEHPERLAAARTASLAKVDGLRLEASIAKLEAIYERLARAREATPRAAADGMGEETPAGRGG
jgi:glycosyltransferase involved in cell wall biosynthesis